VTLRPWRLDDVPAVVAICDDPLSAAYTTVPAPYSETDAHDWLATHHVNLASGDGADFAVTDAADGDVLGSIGVRVHAPGMAEVGDITAPGARGRGVMTRALTLIVPWAFAELGLERLQLGTFPGNAASQRVAEKCGFVHEGLLRRYAVQRGVRVDLDMFARIAGD
jgi:RimJ/RimL family protein N-acetyltransferase